MTGRLKKYLFHFCYFGTRFRGVQLDKRLGEEDRCITKYLKDGLNALSPINTPIVYNSSRTDAGVHALCSTFHCELELCPFEKVPKRLKAFFKEENYITKCLNNYFKEASLDIRILNTRVVPPEFNCRHSAIQRTYLYRLVFTPSYFDRYSSQAVLPIQELNRCQLVCGDFDFEAVESACQIFKGHHNLRFYCSLGKEEKKKEILTQRTIDELKFVPGKPLFNPRYDDSYENLKFYDVVISSKSFLRSQVRRIVGVLVALGKKYIDLEYVRASLEDPELTWNPLMKTAEPHGLYLVKVEYPPEAFIVKEEDPNIAASESPVEENVKSMRAVD